jgi:hypothetical protein
MTRGREGGYFWKYGSLRRRQLWWINVCTTKKGAVVSQFLGCDTVQFGYKSTNVSEEPWFFYPEETGTISYNTLEFMHHTTWRYAPCGLVQAVRLLHFIWEIPQVSAEHQLAWTNFVGFPRALQVNGQCLIQTTTSSFYIHFSIQ